MPGGSLKRRAGPHWKLKFQRVDTNCTIKFIRQNIQNEMKYSISFEMNNKYFGPTLKHRAPRAGHKNRGPRDFLRESKEISGTREPPWSRRSGVGYLFDV